MNALLQCICLLLCSVSVALAYIEQSSAIGEVGAVSFDVSLTGQQKNCTKLTASGALQGFNVSFYFNGENDAEAWPSDMFMLAAIGTNCWVYGGYDDDLSNF